MAKNKPEVVALIKTLITQGISLEAVINEAIKNGATEAEARVVVIAVKKARARAAAEAAASAYQAQPAQVQCYPCERLQMVSRRALAKCPVCTLLNL